MQKVKTRRHQSAFQKNELDVVGTRGKSVLSEAERKRLDLILTTGLEVLIPSLANAVVATPIVCEYHFKLAPGVSKKELGDFISKKLNGSSLCNVKTKRVFGVLKQAEKEGLVAVELRPGFQIPSPDM
ncbi:MAG: hypothetical protein AB1529_03305 [Candidatus Micrarchaeota archaeon]